jgi:hypothetical protein
MAAKTPVINEPTVTSLEEAEGLKESYKDMTVSEWLNLACDGTYVMTASVRAGQKKFFISYREIFWGFDLFEPSRVPRPLATPPGLYFCPFKAFSLAGRRISAARPI